MAEQRATDRWLQRTVQLAAVVLLAMVCLVLWRVARVVGQVERQVVAVSHDVRQVTRTAGRVAERVDHLARRVDELKQETRDALHLQDMQRWWQQAVAMQQRLAERGEAPATASSPTDAEITFLLDRVRQPDLRYRAGDDVESATAFWTKASMKRWAFAADVESTEAFIEQVARETFGSDPYHVVFPDGHEQPVDAWLQTELQLHRQHRAPDEAEMTEP